MFFTKKKMVLLRRVHRKVLWVPKMVLLWHCCENPCIFKNAHNINSQTRAYWMNMTCTHHAPKHRACPQLLFTQTLPVSPITPPPLDDPDDLGTMATLWPIRFNLSVAKETTLEHIWPLPPPFPLSAETRQAIDILSHRTVERERERGKGGERERERETQTVVILHFLNNKNTPCHRPHSHNDHIQHFITPEKCTLSDQTCSAIWNHNRFTQTILSCLTFQQVQHGETIFTLVRRERARCLLAPMTSIRQAWQLAIRFTTLHSLDKEWDEWIVEGNKRVAQRHTNRKCPQGSELTASAWSTPA